MHSDGAQILSTAFQKFIHAGDLALGIWTSLLLIILYIIDKYELLGGPRKLHSGFGVQEMTYRTLL
jgi:hypothetical protein